MRAIIPVGRTGGADGHVSVKWRTKDITAISGSDYQGGEGHLKFDNQETTVNIDIPLFESNVSIVTLSEVNCKLPIGPCVVAVSGVVFG